MGDQQLRRSCSDDKGVRIGVPACLRNMHLGGKGNDQITAGAGNDNVDAGAGTDSCNADGGKNTIKGCES